MMPRQFVAWLTLPVALVSGCSSMSNTESGAAGGGLFGAGAGAIIGHATGHTGAGAVLGAGIGALTGGLIGHAEDQAEKKVAAAHAAPRGAGAAPRRDARRRSRDETSRDDACATARQRLFDEGSFRTRLNMNAPVRRRPDGTLMKGFTANPGGRPLSAVTELRARYSRRVPEILVLWWKWRWIIPCHRRRSWGQFAWPWIIYLAARQYRLIRSARP